MVDKVALQGEGAGRAGGHHEVRVILQHRGHILLGENDGGLPVPGIEGRNAAAVLLLREEDLDAEAIQHVNQIAADFRIDEIVEAAGKEGDAVFRLDHLLRNLLPLVAQRLFGNCRQGAPLGEGGKEERQVADGALAAGHRLLQQARRPDEGMEELAVAQHLLEDERFAGADPLFGTDRFAQVQDDVLQVDLARTDGDAGAAADASAHELGRLVEAMKEGGEDDADGADVDVAEDVAADGLIDRADIGAGAALDAAQGVAAVRRLGQGAAAVVEQDDMQLLARPRRRERRRGSRRRRR